MATRKKPTPKAGTKTAGPPKPKPPAKSDAPKVTQDKAAAVDDKAVELKKPAVAAKANVKPADVTTAEPPNSEKPDAAEKQPALAKPEGGKDPEPRKASVLPMILAGIFTAVVGFGAAMVLQTNDVADPQIATLRETVQAQADTISGLEAQAMELSQISAQTSDAVGGLPGSISDLADTMTARLDGLNADITTLTEDMAALDTRLVQLEKRPVAGGAASASALEAFEREMSEMRTLLDENRSASQATAEDIEAAAAEAQARIEAAEEEAAQLRAQARETTQQAMTRAALSRLQAALDSGAPISGAVEDLGDAGLDIPAVLADAQNIPSLSELERAFPDAARAALAAALRIQADDAGALDRFGAFLRSQTGARSLTPREGDDADAVLSRAEAALQGGDVAGAVSQLAALPPEAQAEMAGWLDMAQTRLAATDAVADLAQALN